MIGIAKSQWEALSQERLEDAYILFEQERFGGAYFHLGFALECALKAVIAGKFRAQVLPDKGMVNGAYTHDLPRLVGHADLMDDLKRASDPVKQNWDVVKNWTSEARYGTIDPMLVHEMLLATAHAKDGIWPWIKTFW